MTTVLVTGANRGIGLAFCRLLQARAERVVAVCRTPSAELEALAAQGLCIEAGLDLTADDAPAELVRRLEGLPLDGVILNAGILEVSGLEDLDPADVRRQFEVNALAPLRLARALSDQMPEGAKLALITSRMGSIADNGSGATTATACRRRRSTWPAVRWRSTCGRAASPWRSCTPAW
jgi:NAD(P)-dependent dehydrogenase (short-subunit alcohol dehydrogenase family)